MLITLTELRRALDNDEIVPHFQPIVELRTGELSGFEVLARWHSSPEGVILPANMIGLAEKHGLIGTLAQQVFSKAFADASNFGSPLKLSVNLSPIQLQDPAVSRQIEEMAANSSFPLSRLTIEITESALLKDLISAKSIARELKELGCRLSLDDFGTGYSSLAHLQSLPFDELKIDRSFVSHMTKKRESRKIVAAIVGLGHSLGMSTVAEGIETEEQADMLLWLGSELGQGWYFGRPTPVEAISSVISKPPRPTALGLAGPGEDWSVSSLEAFPAQRLAQLQAIYDGAPVGLCFLDCELRYVSLNKRLAENNGASVADHLGKTVKEMVPALYPRVESYLLRALAGERIAEVEIPRPRKESAEQEWILISYQPAFDEADEVIGVSVSVMDITEHKRAQDALHESEFVQRHLSALNRQVPWVMDPEGNNMQMSAEWLKQLASTPGQARNLGWLEALHVDDLKPTIKKMKKALRTGEVIDMEYRVQNSEGVWRWMRSRGSPRLGPNGEITRWYGSVEDIHEKKCADERVRETEAKMRALLRAVPVAIIIEEGRRRSIMMDDELVMNETETVPNPTDTAFAIPEEIDIASLLPIATSAKLTHIARVLEDRRASPRKKKESKLKAGLKVVESVETASIERKRLVSMLEEFGTYRLEH